MNTKLKNKYSEYLKYELNYSDNTIKGYFLHLEKYFEFIKQNQINYLKITKEQILIFLKGLDKEKLANRTIANILSSLRTFYDYLLNEKQIEFNVFKLIKNPKIEKTLPNFLSYEQMRLILDSLKCQTLLEKRDKMIIELLYASGIRVSELVNIKLKDINIREKTIRIMGKGAKERIVYFGSYSALAIEDYLNARISDNEYLILNYQNKKITTRSIENIINKITMGLSLKVKVSPHTFRHTFATHMLNNGADIKSVQELLGHESLDTTQVYTHITSDVIKSEYLKRMPRR